MNIQDRILQEFQCNKTSLTVTQICQRLNISQREKKTVDKIVSGMVKNGFLCHDERRRYYLPTQENTVCGTVSATRSGYAFLLPEDRTKYPKDFFIPARKLNGALHGDKVLAIPSPAKFDGRDEVFILKILEHGYTELVGTLYRDDYGFFVRPDDERYAVDIFIDKGKHGGGADGMKVLVRITDFPKDENPKGEVIELLGKKNDFFTEELSLIRSHGLREEFPEKVIQAAKAVPNAVPESALFDRLDLREKRIITVDGEDTRDIDDAISVERTKTGFRLGVHIADVTHYVPFQGVLDKEAFKRGTSVYFPDRVLPMLPKELSNGICSLNEGVDRLTLSCIMDIDKKGNVKERKIVKSVIRSARRMTYQAIEDVAEKKSDALERYPDLAEFVADAFELTRLLKKARRAKGEVELDVKEAKIYLSKEQEIVIPDFKRLFSQEMIEQFMVLANEQVAEFMTQKKMPFVYRIHEQPTPEKAEELKLFLISLGIPASYDISNVSPADYQKILNGLKGDPADPVVNRVMLRSMMKARYDSVNVGHFGLSSKCYCHFTSPIRRYPDLCIHRIIKTVLDGEETEARARYAPFVSEAAVRSSECEKKAVEAERDVDDLYKVMYMSEKIGEEYDGVVSGVTSFGVFVELSNTIEGMIPYAGLPEDDYEYFEERFLLRGKKYSFRIGDCVRIKVAGVDFGNRKIDFFLINKK